MSCLCMHLSQTSAAQFSLSMGSHDLLIFPFLVSSGLSTSDGVGSIDDSVTHSCPPYLHQIVGRS